MKKILIVEDNRLERRLLVYILTEAFGSQIQVTQAHDGDQALEILSKSLFDLVITDLVMPKIEGIELIRKIKIQFHEIISIIAVSGKNPYYLYLAKKLGIQGIFTKPLDKDKLLNTVEKLLNIESKQSISLL
jgi:YesN/AraC family two-component response regulator